jgi:hypothetical protein
MLPGRAGLMREVAEQATIRGEIGTPWEDASCGPNSTVRAGTPPQLARPSLECSRVAGGTFFFIAHKS